MRLFAAAAIGLTVLACHRAADEPPSPDARSVALSSASERSADGAPNRCVFPTLASAPPPVASGPAAGCPADPNPHTLDLVTVRFPEAASGPVSITAELARTFPDRERGLMFRTQLDEDRGMLFDLGERKIQQFWMRNTCLPLDIIFIDEDGFVVGVLENVPTLNEKQRSVPCPSAFVLEANAGWARRNGVRAGSFARLPGA